MSGEPDTILDEFERTAVESVRLSVSRYRGRKYLDIRTWYQNPSGEWKPTRKGVKIKESELNRLRSAIDLAEGLSLEQPPPQQEVTEYGMH
jgi:hypothetical protein